MIMKSRVLSFMVNSLLLLLQCVTWPQGGSSNAVKGTQMKSFKTAQIGCTNVSRSLQRIKKTCLPVTTYSVLLLLLLKQGSCHGNSKTPFWGRSTSSRS